MSEKQIHQYELQERLGTGAFGVVYRAHDTRLRRPVVIKMLHRSLLSNDNKRTRLLEEARLAAAIEHPNVCAVYEVGDYEGRPFIVMQYVPGPTLKQVIEEGPLSLHFALSIAIQMADGLAATHRLGILHRDLKPANVIITDDGVAKMLDFGLARRMASEAEAAADPAAAPQDHLGTVAYMAPEQFVTHQSSQQSDLFALGVILYEMVTARHPFRLPNADAAQVALSIQYRPPERPGAIRPDLPGALEDVILKTLAREPAHRFAFAAEARDALRALMRSLHLEAGVVPGEASAVLPAPAPRAAEKAGLFSALAERLMPGRSARPARNALAVVPFQDLRPTPETRFYGFALADALATRLARLPRLVVRPPSALLSTSEALLDPVEAGKRLLAERVLSGSYVRSDEGFTLNWQLLDVASKTLRAGGTATVPPMELATLQSAVADDVVAALHVSGELEAPAAEASGDRPAGEAAEALPEEVREAYLEAQALLQSVAARSSPREDLEQARLKYKHVLEHAPDFAPAHAGLGLAQLGCARHGSGHVDHLLAAQGHLEHALALDPDLREARLGRLYTLLWAGEKESARLDVQYLLRAASDDAEVHLGAGVLLQSDGLLEEALRAFGKALRLDASTATRVYSHRARLYLLLGQHDLALEETSKGLLLEPDHTLLRTTLGEWFLQESVLDRAIATLEGVVTDDPDLQLAYPTLAVCYARANRLDEAAALITEATLAAAATDGEMAYRLGGYWAVIGEAEKALHGLRNAIYLGNENYPWFIRDPSWAALQGNQAYQEVLSDLKQIYRFNQARWERLSAAMPA